MARESANPPADSDELRDSSRNRPNNKQSISRRDYVKLGLAAAATVAGTSTIGSQPVRAAAPEPQKNYTRILDAVDDLGCDPSGATPIESVVEDAATDGTCIEFPDGEYQIGQYLDIGGVQNVGLRAASGASPVLVPGTPGKDLPGGWLFIRIEAANFEFGGFDIDFSRDGYYGEIICDATSGDLHVHDIRRVGLVPGNIDGIWLANMSSSGVGLVENVQMRDGAREGPSATGLQVRATHAGEIHIVDCDLWHFPSKGIYASGPAVGAGGTVHVNGGLFKNNNDCDVRIGSAGSTVKNIVSIKEDTTQGETVTWERPIPYRHWDDRTDIIQTRSIRLKDGRDVLIEGCEFRHEIGSGAGVITAEGSHEGGTTIRDVRINVDGADIYPILLQNGSDDGYLIENVSITGVGGRGVGIRVEADNHGTEVRNSCLQLTADGVNGIELLSSDNCTIAETNINVPGEAVVTSDASVETVSLTYGDSCPLPGQTDTTDSTDSTDGTDTTDSTDSTDGTDTTDSTDSTNPSANTLEIKGTGVATNYRFTVEGDVTADRKDLEKWDTVSSPDVEGWVTTTKHVDTYRFSDGVSSFEYVEGEASLVLNGQPVTVQELLDFPTTDDGSTDGTTDGTTDDSTSDSADESTETLARELVIQGTGTATNYVVVVDGDLAVGQNDTLEGWDSITGSVATGWVTTTEHVDTYQFSGDVEYVGFKEGSADVSLDGEPVAVEEVGYQHTMTVVGYGSATTTYTIGTSGNVLPHPLENDPVELTPASSLTDSVTTESRSYLYDGDITQFSLDGDAAVYVDGEQVDPSVLEEQVAALPNLIVFDGTNVDTATEYSFAVTGTIERSPDLGSAETSDTIDAGQVTGTVNGDIDGYRFTGNISSMDVSGNVRMRFEDIDG